MKRKKITLLFLLMVSIVAFTSCGTYNDNANSQIEQLQSENEQLKQQIADEKATEKGSVDTPRSSSTPSSSSKAKTVAFTNKFGTSTTICAHSGCNNYIAPSGDTNCCTTHSRKCLECNSYIDEDATWCIPCIEKALKK